MEAHSVNRKLKDQTLKLAETKNKDASDDLITEML